MSTSPAAHSAALSRVPAPMDPSRAGRPPGWVAPLIAGLVVVVGVVLLASSGRNSLVALVLGVLMPAALVLLFDRAPGLALVGLALVLLGHLGLNMSLSGVLMLVAPILIFGGAAFGSQATMVLSGIAVGASPVAFLGLILLARFGVSGIDSFTSGFAWSRLPAALAAVLRDFPVSFVFLLVMMLVVPWILGLAWRSVVRSRRDAAQAAVARGMAERETEAARDIARLRAGQTQLARDVHDVVGHSLAVILAQAQSAQYLGDDEVDKMRETLGHVADTARRSLGDVRAVLSGTREQASAASAGLESLIAGVRAAGNEVIERVEGVPRPLPPELEQVVYRVTQEMLTNALKHGRAGGPVWVRQVWPDTIGALVRIDVHNLIDAPPPALEGGIGLGSMADRLASVGGGLRTEIEDTVQGLMFGASAWLPLRAAEVQGAAVPAVERVAG